MKIVYISHPIGGDVEGNLQKLTNIIREININMPDIVPFVPYYADCIALEDSKPEERARGIKNDREFFFKGVIEEVWLFGPKISAGMRAEMELAVSLSIPVFAISYRIQHEVAEQYLTGVRVPSALNMPASISGIISMFF